MNSIRSGLLINLSFLVIPALIYIFAGKYRKSVSKPLIVLSVMWFVFSIYKSSMTYGPRNTLESNSIPTMPEKIEITETQDIFEQKDRSTIFSDRLEKEIIE